MRNMSFAMTKDQMRAQIKTVTRRLRWESLKPGDLIQPVEKCQGLKKGEHVKKIGCPIRILGVVREKLNDIREDDVKREGYPGMKVWEFIDIFMRVNKCSTDQKITCIEFEFVNNETITLLATKGGNPKTTMEIELIGEFVEGKER